MTAPKKAPAKKKRGDFALPANGKHGPMFPLNTAGRVAAAPGMASLAASKGTISKAEAAAVKKKAAAKRKK